MYDFNIIPVELISNIYEILLGREARAKDNAFYTPNYLVEYILDKTTLGFLKEHTNDFDLVEWVLFDSHTQSVYEAELKKFM